MAYLFTLLAGSFINVFISIFGVSYLQTQHQTSNYTILLISLRIFRDLPFTFISLIYLDFLCLCIRYVVTRFLCSVNVQVLEHHLLKGLCFLHCNTFEHLSKMVFYASMLFHSSVSILSTKQQCLNKCVLISCNVSLPIVFLFQNSFLLFFPFP